MSSSVLPEPAGARTMNDVAESSARARASLSVIAFIPYTAQRSNLAKIASTLTQLRVDPRIARTELLGQGHQSSPPPSRVPRTRLELRQHRVLHHAQEPQPVGANTRERGARHRHAGRDVV